VGGFHFDVLALGGYHTCGLVAGGVAYCWGNNHFGQLGDGSTTDASGPKAVAGGLTFKAITAGITPYSCAITTADTVYCWGKNDVGQLGNGGTNSSAMPVAVSGWPAQ
jgi:alpha-tubulin suppressor-like RCC1 family protein